MTICSKIKQKAGDLSAVTAVIGKALDEAEMALDNAIATLSPFVKDEAAPNGELGDGAETEGGAASEGETV